MTAPRIPQTQSRPPIEEALAALRSQGGSGGRPPIEEALAKIRAEERSGIENFARGVPTGLAKTGTAAMKGAAWIGNKLLPGDPLTGLERFARESEEEAQSFYDPQGKAGAAGELTGRILGEGATTLAGGGLVGKAIAKAAPASKLAKAISVGSKGNFAQRVAAQTAPFVPVDFAMGAGAAQQGESRLKSGALNVALGAAGATAIEGIGAGVRALKGARKPFAETLEEAATLPSPRGVAKITPEQADAVNAGHRAIRNAPAGDVSATPKAIAHIWENPARRAKLEALGYTSADNFLDDVGQGFTDIYDTGHNSIALARHMPDGRVIWANLSDDVAPQWVVGSGTSTPPNYLKNKTRLWPPAPEGGPGSTRAGNSLAAADPVGLAPEGSDLAGAERLTEPQSRSLKLPNRPGTVNPQLLAPIATTGVGVATGAALDDDNRIRGALIGGGVGLGVGILGARAARSLGQQAPPPAAYMADPAVTKVASSIARDIPAMPAGLGDAGQVARKAYTAVVDELYPLRQFGREVGGSERLSYEAARASGWKGSAEARVRTDFKRVLEQVRGHEDGVTTLAKAQRALELLDAGLEKTDIPRADLEATVYRLSNIPEVQQGAEAIRGYYRSLLDAKLANGVIDQEAYDAITASGKYYVPFVRDFQAMAKAPSAGGGKFINRGTGVRKMTDGMASAKTVDPFQQAVLDTFEAERTIAKQRVSNTVASIVEANPTEAAPFIRKVADRNAATSGRAVQANIGGTRQTYEVLDKDLYDAWAAFDPKTQNIFQKLLAIPKRTLRTGVTLLPDFAIANAIRDNAQAAIQYKAPVRSMLGGSALGAALGAATADEGQRTKGALAGAGIGLGLGALAPTAVRFGQGLADVLGKSDDYMQWLKEGGGGFSDFYARPADAKKLIAQMANEQPSWAASIVRPKSALGAIAELGKAIEEAPRVARFKAMKEAGAEIPEAIASSRDISLDFANLGKDTKGIASMTAFWNAKVQGWDKLGRLLKNPKTYPMALASLTAPSIALWSINKDDPEYWQTPQWERNLFWLVPRDHEPGESPFYRIPKPFELGFLFASLPERFLDYVYERDPETLQYALTDMLSTAGEGTVPFPTAAQPIIENATNYSMFRNRPIVSRGLERLPNEMQYDNRTSSAAVGLGKVTGSSPQKIDNILRSYTGSAGGQVLDLTSKAARKLGIDNRVAPPESKPPIIGRFLSRADQTSDAEEAVRRRFKETDKIRNGAKELYESGDLARFGEFVRENRATLIEYEAIKERNDALNEIAKAKRDFLARRDVPDDEKRAAATRLSALARQIASQPFDASPPAVAEQGDQR